MKNSNSNKAPLFTAYLLLATEAVCFSIPLFLLEHVISKLLAKMTFLRVLIK